ncbi:MAG: KTSC domain-containing protein [Solirubrobacteraceae bacterium]
MQPVASEAVARIGYDEATRELHVEFTSGRAYVYLDVPAATWQEFEASESKGRFVNATLKPRYAYRERSSNR